MFEGFQRLWCGPGSTALNAWLFVSLRLLFRRAAAYPSDFVIYGAMADLSPLSPRPIHRGFALAHSGLLGCEPQPTHITHEHSLDEVLSRLVATVAVSVVAKRSHHALATWANPMTHSALATLDIHLLTTSAEAAHTHAGKA